MILDATAGNRRFWRNYSDNIIYIDIQKKLEKKPTMFADNRKLPFQDKTFHTIIYDPPHTWDFSSIFFGFPDKESWIKNHPNDNRQYPTYYGMDIYKSKTSLISSIYKAQKELSRVIVDDGVLWLNWSELTISLNKIIVLFSEWDEYIRLRITSQHQTLSNTNNWWVCFMKKNTQQSGKLKTHDLETYM